MTKNKTAHPGKNFLTIT